MYEHIVAFALVVLLAFSSAEARYLNHLTDETVLKDSQCSQDLKKISSDSDISALQDKLKQDLASFRQAISDQCKNTMFPCLTITDMGHCCSVRGDALWGGDQSAMSDVNDLAQKGGAIVPGNVAWLGQIQTYIDKGSGEAYSVSSSYLWPTYVPQSCNGLPQPINDAASSACMQDQPDGIYRVECVMTW